MLMTSHNIDSEVKNLLMYEEEILLTATQSKTAPGGSLSTPNSIYVTNTRVIFKNPKLFGLKADIIDANYRDISNVRLKRGLFSTEIYLKTRNRADEIVLPAVDKQIANEVINLIQNGLRNELPNQRLIERNYQGQVTAVNINTTSSGSHADDGNNNNNDLLQRLEKLTDLKQKGALSDSEFQVLKNDILKKLSGKDFSIEPSNSIIEIESNNALSNTSSSIDHIF